MIALMQDLFTQWILLHFEMALSYLSGIRPFVSSAARTLLCLCPPLAVYASQMKTSEVILNVVLTTMGYLPGVVHAVYHTMNAKETASKLHHTPDLTDLVEQCEDLHAAIEVIPQEEVGKVKNYIHTTLSRRLAQVDPAFAQRLAQHEDDAGPFDIKELLEKYGSEGKLSLQMVSSESKQKVNSFLLRSIQRSSPRPWSRINSD